ncbi:MAG: cyclic nucleotide-binding domain-containing protein [Cyanobacteria bacterium J06623_5]
MSTYGKTAGDTGVPFMLRIVTAKSPEKIDEVLKLRHQVLAVEEGFLPRTASHRIIDRFDAFPSTTHLMAIQDDQLIGAMRLTMDSEVGIPADEEHEFNIALPAGSHLLCCSLYCVKRDYRSTQVMLGLLLMASYLGVANGVTHLIAPTDPKILTLIRRKGFVTPTDHVEAPFASLNIKPLLLDIEQDLKDFFASFVEHNDIEGFIQSYECAFYEPGEYIIRAGEIGDCAFVLVDGEVAVKYSGSEQTADTMVAGAVFGEMSLLTDQRRSANIVAKTRVRVMTLSRAIFLEHLHNNPAMAMSMLKSMSSRMQHLIDQRVKTVA